MVNDVGANFSKATEPTFFYFFFLFGSGKRLGIGQIVDGDSQEDVQENIITANEENDVVEGDEHAEAADAAKRFNTVVHDRVPILTGQDL